MKVNLHADRILDCGSTVSRRINVNWFRNRCRLYRSVRRSFRVRSAVRTSTVFGNRFTEGLPVWPNRDPLGDRGFLGFWTAAPRRLKGAVNLYAFVHNCPGVHIDALGLEPIPGWTLSDCLADADKVHDQELHRCRCPAIAVGVTVAVAGALGGPVTVVIAIVGEVVIVKAEHKCEDRANERWKHARDQCWKDYGYGEKSTP
mgnify:CR=1 FL=1